MLQPLVSGTVSLRSLPLLAILVLAPALAQADDFSFDGGGGCDDPPPITSDIFTLPPTNATGGMCLAFGNHSGSTFTSLKFTTPIPDADLANPSNPQLCSGGPFFTTCDFVEDLLDDTITVEFFGLDTDHQGIPVVPIATGIEISPDNFEINLNNPGCDPLTGLCAQPGDANGTGDWVSGGQPEVFTAAANGVPEAATLMLLLGGIGALVARAQFQRNSRVR
jgi:hypothetical protein